MWLDMSLGDIVNKIPSATRVFHDYKLDFCCGGQASLRDAAEKKGVDATEINNRLEALRLAQVDIENNWLETDSATLIDYIITRFHERHRIQLPELIRLSTTVERVHAQSVECPTGLAEHLTHMFEELQNHMAKEEQVLFPYLRQGSAVDLSRMAMPINVMRAEHDTHGESVEKIGALTHQIQLPEGACNTWRALYAGLSEFREDLMQHIHLENNVLFNRT